MNSFNPETDSLAQRLIALAIEEDLGSGDITTELLVPKHTAGKARIIAKEQLTVCGLLVAKAVFKQLDPEFSFSAKVTDGVVVSAGEEIASMSGSLQTILSGERTFITSTSASPRFEPYFSNTFLAVLLFFFARLYSSSPE